MRGRKCIIIGDGSVDKEKGMNIYRLGRKRVKNGWDMKEDRWCIYQELQCWK